MSAGTVLGNLGFWSGGALDDEVLPGGAPYQRLLSMLLAGSLHPWISLIALHW